MTIDEISWKVQIIQIITSNGVENVPFLLSSQFILSNSMFVVSFTTFQMRMTAERKNNNLKIFYWWPIIHNFSLCVCVFNSIHCEIHQKISHENWFNTLIWRNSALISRFLSGFTHTSFSPTFLLSQHEKICINFQSVCKNIVLICDTCFTRISIKLIKNAYFLNLFISFCCCC